LNPRSGLKTRKLLILRNAKTDRNAKYALVGYAAVTDSESTVALGSKPQIRTLKGITSSICGTYLQCMQWEALCFQHGAIGIKHACLELSLRLCARQARKLGDFKNA